MTFPFFLPRAGLLSAAVTTAFFVSLSIAQAVPTPMPDVDPTREWLGEEYADTVYSRFRAEHPDLSLVVDLKDLRLFAKGKPSVISDNAISSFVKAWWKSKQGGLRGRLVDGLRATFDPSLADLIQTLELGAPIDLAMRGPSAAALLRWVEGQPENSIYPDALMSEALRLSDGHVLAAWALTWNVMRDDWKLASVRNYGEFRAKFASLTGERHLWEGGARYVVIPEDERETGDSKIDLGNGRTKRSEETPRRLQMVISKRGDEYSYLYHRLGVELLSMVSSELGGSSNLGWVVGSAGALGEVTKFSQTAGLDGEKKKRVRNDLAAARSGTRLYKLISSGAKPPLKLAQISPSRYLKSNPDEFGGDYKLTGKRPAHYYGSDADPKYWAPTMTVDELKLRFAHAREYDGLIFDPVILASNADGERLHRGLAAYGEQGAKDDELNKLLADYMHNVQGIPKEYDVQFDIDLDLNTNQDFTDRNVVFGENRREFDFLAGAQRLHNQVSKILGLVEARRSARPVVQRDAGSALRCARALSGS